ncbi:MAG: FG-GAP-like repeat-containing protein [Acidobacteriota bacterium]
MARATRSHRTAPNVLTVSLLGAAWILFATGAGGFQIPFDNGNLIDSGNDRGFSVDVGDIDHDGDLDVFATSRNTTTAAEVDVSVWRNDGAGTWTQIVIEDRFLGAAWISLGDLDGDGDLDAAAAGFDNAGAGFTAEVMVYLNSGDGSTWTPIEVDTSFSGADVLAIGDIDGDGDLDLAGGSMNIDDVVWWRNSNGDAVTWVRQPNIDSTFNGTRGLDLADIDRDGDLDVVAAAEFDDTVAWWENTVGDGSAWGPETTINTLTFDGAAALCTGDFDGDGAIDVAAVAEDGDAVAWWRNAAGDGSLWTETTIDLAYDGGHGLRAGDLDGDGDLDLVTASRFDQDVSYWENLAGDGSAWAEQLVDGAFVGRGSAIADIDGDGDLDPLATGDNDRVEWWANDSSHLRPAFPLENMIAGGGVTTFASARDVALGDVDGDGTIDLVATVEVGDQVVLVRNTAGIEPDGTPELLASAAGALYWGVALGDMDGDGDLDAVVTHSGTGTVSVLRNADGAFGSISSVTVDSTFAGARGVSVGDLDGDGDLDIAAAAFNDEQLAWWENTLGDASAWSETIVVDPYDGAQTVSMADMDRDGDLDLLGVAETADDVTWFDNELGDGSSWLRRDIDIAYDGANDAVAADVDGDGDLDVFAVAELDDDVTWFENTDGAATTWTEHTIDIFFNGARSIAAADVDRDGDLDAVAAQSKDGGVVAWFENTAGDGSAWTQRDVTTAFDGATAVAVADFDRNGLIDLTAVADVDNEVSTWRNLGGQAVLEATDTSPASLGDSVTAELFAFVLTPQGFVTEADTELAQLALLFEETPGDPLSSAEVNAILDNLFVYRDDPVGAAPGVFDGADTLVTTVAAIGLDADGVEALVLPDAALDVRVAQGETATFFLVVETAADYSSQGLSSFRIVHQIERDNDVVSSVEDRTADFALRLAFEPDTATGLFEVNPTPSAADLAISITESSDPATAGTDITYTVTVTNNGPDPATSVLVDGVLSGAVDFVSTSGCAEDPTGFPQCTLGDLVATGQASFDLVARVRASATAGISLEVTASSSATDPTPGNESAVEATAVTRAADLAVVVSGDREYIGGERLDLTITASNLGPSDASGARFENAFPAEVAGVTWTCSGTGGGTCPSNGSGDFDLTVDLPAGASVIAVASGIVAPAATTTIQNTASITAPAGVPDANSANDTDLYDIVWSNPIFFDGFESGTFGAWSGTVP